MTVNFIFKGLLSCILRVPVSQMTFKVSLPLYVVDNFTFPGLYLHKVHSTDYWDHKDQIYCLCSSYPRTTRKSLYFFKTMLWGSFPPPGGACRRPMQEPYAASSPAIPCGVNLTWRTEMEL